MSLKQQIQDVATKIASKVDEKYTDASIIFLSHWRMNGVVDTHTFVQGDGELLMRGFEGAERDMRRMERCNLNPCEKSTKELGELMMLCAKDGDPEVGELFMEISTLLTGGPRPIGEAILIITWNDLGIHFRKSVEFVGMARGIVQLFNAGYDSFRKISTS
jgi:hypothetical protein